MTVTDTVNKHLSSYPSLYLAPTWEDTKFAVLHHMFIVLGNGVEWAHTKNPAKGGYLTDPSSYRRNGGWVRKYDLPYGREKCPLDPRYFTEKLYDVAAIDKRLSHIIGAYKDLNKPHHYVFESDLKMTEEYVMQGTKPVLDHHTHVIDLVEPRAERASPYPNFHREYSPFWQIKPDLIQSDWCEAAIEHLTYWQGYFDDAERVKSYSYYSKPEDLRKHIEQYYKTPTSAPNSAEREGDIAAFFEGRDLLSHAWMDKVRKDYEYPAFDGRNYETMATHRWQKTLAEARAFCRDTIARLS